MSEQDIPALSHNPHWLITEPDLLPRFDQPRRDTMTRRDAPADARARMPPTTRSGYEQLIAARAAMRARVDRGSEWRSSIDVAPSRAFATGRSAERPRPRVRRHRPGLAVAGLLAAPPACFLLAFIWVGSPRSPTARIDGPAQSAQASLPISGAAGAALPAAGEERAIFAIRDRYALPRTETAEAGALGEDAPLGPVLGGARDATAAPPEREEAVVAARDFGVPGLVADVGPSTPQESASSRPAPTGAEDGSAAPFVEGEPVFAAWDEKAWRLMVGVEPDASPNGPPPGPAARLADGEQGSAVLEAQKPVLAAGHQDAPTPVVGAGADTLHEGEPTPATAAEAAGDALATEPNAWTTPVGIPTAPVADAGATALGAEKQTALLPALAAPIHQEPASGADPALAFFNERSPEKASATAIPTRPVAAADATMEAASAAPAAGTVTRVAPVELTARPAAAASPQGRMATLAPPAPPLLSTGGAPSTKLRPGEAAPAVSRVAARDAPPSSPSPDSRCRAIVLKAQLGEETSHAERSLLRNGCGARR